MKITCALWSNKYCQCPVASSDVCLKITCVLTRGKKTRQTSHCINRNNLWPLSRLFPISDPEEQGLWEHESIVLRKLKLYGRTHVCRTCVIGVHGKVSQMVDLSVKVLVVLLPFFYFSLFWDRSVVRKKTQHFDVGNRCSICWSYIYILYSYIDLYLIYCGKKKTNKLLVHPYRPVSWLPTHQGI